MMHRLITVFSTLSCLSYGNLVRLPKIYNALISSDDNLTPSHAYPIVEPVLRSTALGVAFPPIVIQPTKVEEVDDLKIKVKVSKVKNF